MGRHVRRPGRRVSTPTSAARRRTARNRRLELVYLPGLEAVVRDEIAERLPALQRAREVPGRQDALAGDLTGPLEDTARLRTIVAAFHVLSFPVANPRALLSGDYMPDMLDAIREVVSLNRQETPRSLRIEAAGRDSPVLRRLATQLAAGAGLREDADCGDCVVRVRPTPGSSGWDVLVRLSTRPLSTRSWRVQGHPAAANATVAAAMARLSHSDPEQRVANLMCGSGTLLIERIMLTRARAATGVDLDPKAINAAEQNVAAAKLSGQVRLLNAGVEDDAWLADGPYDVLLADPPWGDKAGRHDESEDLHLTLLRRAHDGAAPEARLVVLTHEIKVMERCMVATADLWRPVSQTKVFHKGHHPRIYVLDRTPSRR
ncbi:methyltransferase [Paractinoplanes rishiriensis]|uniref:RNA methyltransferase n=1 Tax=Paractinoplanes rishiriensis TaxID=1050105 RepID=A0A919KBL9_9ACTN|nr:methyltransferase [Actinoplanes rishiriensis]GIF02433.1 RNA methyltransferase [Actinoplanes rishiriensis]